MSNTVGGVGALPPLVKMVARMQRLHPPSPVEGPSLRTDGGDKGYLQKAALDRDPRLTPQERSDALQRPTDALDRQAQSVGLARAIEAKLDIGGGPPSPDAGEGGLTPPALSGERQAAGQWIPLSASLVADGDKADRDHDGEISFQEAKAFYAASEGAAAALGADARIGTTAPTDPPIEARVLVKIMQLVHAYRLHGEDGPAGGVSVSSSPPPLAPEAAALQACRQRVRSFLQFLSARLAYFPPDLRLSYHLSGFGDLADLKPQDPRLELPAAAEAGPMTLAYECRGAGAGADHPAEPGAPWARSLLPAARAGGRGVALGGGPGGRAQAEPARRNGGF